MGTLWLVLKEIALKEGGELLFGFLLRRPGSHLRFFASFPAIANKVAGDEKTDPPDVPAPIFGGHPTLPPCRTTWTGDGADV